MKSQTTQDDFLNYEQFALAVSVRLQQYRLNAKLSQRDMANIIGVSKTYLSNIERGKTKLPAYILNAYCHILHIAPETFLDFKYKDGGLEADILKSMEHLSLMQKETIRTMVKALEAENLEKQHSSA